MSDTNNYLGKLSLGKFDALNPSGMSQTDQVIAEGDNLQQNLLDAKSAVNKLNAYDSLSYTKEEMAAQAVQDVGVGAWNMIGGLGTAGAVVADSVLGTDIAKPVSEGVNWVTERMNRLDMPGRTLNKEIAQAKTKEIQDTNRALYGDGAKAELHNFLDTMGSLSADDVGQLAGEGVGTILGTAATAGIGGVANIGLRGGTRLLGSQGAKQSTKVAAKETAKNQAVRQSAEQTIAKNMDKVSEAVEAATNPSILAKYANKRTLATMAVIGGSEGGNQAAEFIDKVYSTDSATLMESSKQYRDLIDLGYTDEEARKAVAKSGALQVLVETGIAAATISGVTGAAKFESTPFKMGSLGKLAGNVAKETGEETVQSISNRTLTNKTIGERVDSSVGIYDGVGVESAYGAVGGSLSAGIIQSPATAVEATKEGTKAIVKGAGNLIDRVSPEKEQVSEVIKAPTSKAEAVAIKEQLQGKTLEEAFDIAGIKDPRVFGRNRESYVNMTANKESSKDLKTVAKLSMMADMVNFNVPVDKVKEVSPYVTDEIIQNLESLDENNTVSPIEVLLNVKEGLSNGTIQTDDVQQAMLETDAAIGDLVKNNIEPFAEVFGSLDTDGLIDTSTPEGSGLSYKVSAFSEYNAKDPEGLYGIYEDALNAREIRNQQQIKANPTDYVNNNVDMSTIFGKQEASPAQIQEAMKDIDDVLKHFNNMDDSQFTEEDKATFNRVKAMKDIISKYRDTVTGTTSNDVFSAMPDTVVDNSTGEVNEDSSKLFAKSFKGHVQSIADAYATGDMKATNDAITDMGMFVHHMRNKARAVNKSIEGYTPESVDAEGKKVKGRSNTAEYQALGRKSRVLDHNSTITIHPNNEASMDLAKQINQEANDASELFGLVMDAYPTGRAKPNLTPIVLTGTTVDSSVESDKKESKEPVKEPVTETKEETKEEIKEETKETTKESVEETKEEVEEEVKEEVEEETTANEEVTAKEEPTVVEEPAKEDTVEEEPAKEDTVEEEAVAEDMSDYKLSEISEDDVPVDDWSDYSLDGIITMEDSVNDSIDETVTEELSDSNLTVEQIMEESTGDINSDILLLESSFNPSNTDDNYVRAFFGDNIFKVIDQASLRNVELMKTLEDSFGNFFKNMGLTNSIIYKMFVTKGKDGKKDFFNRSAFINFARKMGRTSEIYKQYGLLDRGTLLKDIDVNDGSVGSYYVTRSVLNSLNRNGKTILEDSINNVLSKSQNPVYKDLVGTKGKNSPALGNTIVEGNDFNLNNPSPAMFAKNPLKAMWSFLDAGLGNKSKTSKALKEKAEFDVGNDLETYKAFTNGVIERLQMNANAFIWKFAKEPGTLKQLRTNMQSTVNGKRTPYNFRFGNKTINAATPVGTEGYSMDKRTVEAYGMAVLDSLFEAFNPTAKEGDNLIDTRDVMGLGLEGEEADTTVNQFTRNVVRKANAILGTRYNPNAPEGVTKGTSFAIAADIISLFEGIIYRGKPLITKTYVTTTGISKKSGRPYSIKTFTGYEFSRQLSNTDNKSFEKMSKVAVNLYSDTALTATEPMVRTKPFEAKQGDLVRNSVNVEITEADIKHLNDLNNIPNTVNTAMVNHLEGADTIALAQWLFDDNLSDISKSIASGFTKGNKYKLDSDRAKYNTLLDSIAHLSRVKESMDKHYETKDTPFEVFVKYSKGKENRTHAEGAMNSQTNKVIREALSANESNIDISSPGVVLNTYLTGLAQGLGFKVNNRSRQDVANEFTEAMKDYSDSLNLINSYLESGNSPINAKVLKAIKADRSKAATKVDDNTMVALHNLIDYSRYLNATNAELKSFDTWTYLEIDGVTKGVGDSMIIYSNDPNMIVTASDKTGNIASSDMEEFVERVHNPNNKDIYVTGGENFSEIASSKFDKAVPMYKSFVEHAKKRANKTSSYSEKPYASIIPMGAVKTLFETYDLQLKFNDNGSISVSRNFSKSPVMVINYGAGATSVSRTMLSAMRDLHLERLDKVAKSNPKNGVEAMQIYFGNTDSKEANIDRIRDLAHAIDTLYSTDVKFEMTKDGVPKVTTVMNPVDYGNSARFKEIGKAITENYYTDGGFFLVQEDSKKLIGMDSAIGSSLKEAVQSISPIASENMEMLASFNDTSSRIASAVFEYMIDRKWGEIHKENPKREKDNGLSENEYKEVIDAFRAKFGKIRTSNTGSIDLFTTKQSDLEGHEFTATTRGYSDPATYKRNLERTKIVPLGVSTSPLTTISTEGDMLANFLDVAPKELIDSLVTIHDGYNVSGSPYLADMLSLLMNLSAVHAWEKSNTFQNAYDFGKTLMNEVTNNRDIAEKVFINKKGKYDKLKEREANDMLNQIRSISESAVNPISNGIVTNGMNGADVPVQVTADGKTNVVPLLEILFAAKEQGIDIDIRAIALSGAIEPVSYKFSELGESLKSGEFQKRAIEKFNEEKALLETYKQESLSSTVDAPTRPSSIGKATRPTRETSKAISVKDTMDKYVLPVVKGSTDEGTKDIAKAVDRLTKHKLFKNTKFRESSSMDENHLGMFNREDNIIYLNSKEAGTKKGLDTIYHEMIHAVTVDFLIDASNGNFSEYSPSDAKILKAVYKNLSDSIKDISESTDLSNVSVELQNFIKRYIDKPGSLDIGNPNHTKAIAELIAHVPTKESLRKDLQGIKGKASKESLSVLQKLVNAVDNFKKAVFKMIGLKDFRSINNLANSITFSTETLIRLLDEGSNTPDGTPPSGGGKPSVGKSKIGSAKVEPTTEAGKMIQESLDLFNNFHNIDDAQATTDKYNKATLQVKMDFAETLGLLENQDQVTEATSIAYVVEYSKKTNGVQYSRIAEVYEEALKTLKADDFLTGNTATDRIMADARFNYFKEIPTTNNSRDAIAIFAGLAHISPILQRKLSTIKYGGKSLKGMSFEEAFSTSVDNMVNALYDNSLTTFRGDSTASTHLRELLGKLNKVAESEDTIVDRSLDKLTDYNTKANDYVLTKLTKLSNAAFKSTSGMRSSKNKVIRAVGNVMIAPAMFYADKTLTENMMENTMKFVSGENTPRFLRELVSDIVGRTDFGGDIYDMIKTVKSKIQAIRQMYRDEVPKELLSKYKTKLNDAQKSAINDVLIKTDLGSLLNVFNFSDVVTYISNTNRRRSEIRLLESNIQLQEGSATASVIIRKSKELAKYMVDRTTSNNLLKNADQIAYLNGEGVYVNDPDSLVKGIDALVSLYALEMTPKEQLDIVKDLISTDSTGLKDTLEYSNGLTDADINSKNATDLSRGNRLKGYMPITNKKPSTLVEVEKDKIKEFTRRGYTLLETTESGSAYMFTDVRTKGVFHQGIIQTVRPAVGGADAYSGMVQGISYGGLVTDTKEVARITNGIGSNNPAFNNYIPVYRNLGDNIPYAFQRVPNSKTMAHLSLETDFSKLLSNHTGRKVEETLAIKANQSLVDSANELYDNSTEASKKRDFVDIMDEESLSKDPVLRDAANLIPPPMRAYIKKVNKGKLMVRRDMLNDVTGYRMAMAGDFWTGNTRFKKEIQESMSTIFENVLGKGAYRKIMRYQHGLQSFVSDARDIIVIRSIIVPTINIASNMAQAITRGISPITVAKGYITKSKEITRYLEIREHIIKLEAQRISNFKNKAKLKEIQGRIDMLEESMTKLSIYPLIKAGEYTSVTDNLIDRNDLTIMEGGLLSYVENKIDKLPKGLSTVAKWSIISSDTALYDTLKKATDYGDFIAKSIYYDKLLRTGKSQSEAIAAIREEYVNYDKLQGRLRHTLENLGLMWFWNWKLRSTKTMASIIKNNPVNALIYSFSPLNGAMGIGTPLEESFGARIFGDKSLTGSMGIGLGLNAWTNLPIGWAFK